MGQITTNHRRVQSPATPNTMKTNWSKAELRVRRDRIKIETSVKYVRTKDVCSVKKDHPVEARMSAIIFIDDKEAACLTGATCEDQAKRIVDYIVNANVDLLDAMSKCVADRKPEMKRKPKKEEVLL